MSCVQERRRQWCRRHGRGFLATHCGFVKIRYFLADVCLQQFTIWQPTMQYSTTEAVLTLSICSCSAFDFCRLDPLSDRDNCLSNARAEGRRSPRLIMSDVEKFIRRNPGPVCFTVAAIVVIVAGFWLARCFWWWLHPVGAADVSNSDTLRNVGLLIGGVIAFLFGVWRAWVAERQADASQGQTAASIRQVDAVQVQVEATQRQAETAQQSLLNERYQRGAEMLASSILHARLGGIYALQSLAEEALEQYHVEILLLFCAFARDPDGDQGPVGYSTVDPNGVLWHSLRPDVQAAVEGVSRILKARNYSRGDFAFDIDLRGARLNGIRLESGYLSGADLSYAQLVRADLENTVLRGANLLRVQLLNSILRRTDLSRCEMYRTDFTDAVLDHARLDGGRFTDCNFAQASFLEASVANAVFSDTPITQHQLNQTRASPFDPPIFLTDPVDPQTDRPLNFHGEPLRRQP